MRRKIVALTVAGIFLAACGGTATRPGATASPSVAPSSPTPTVSASTQPTATGPLFAVLESRHTANGLFDTVAIADFNGYARAKTTFAPRRSDGPMVPFARPMLPVPAQVAAGAVYFLDGSGVVRRLDPSGAVRVLTTFPITSSQQVVSFAVSPDGKQLMAARFAYNSIAPGPSGGPPYTTTGPEQLDLMVASAGGSASTIKHWSGTAVHAGASAQPQFHNLTMAGWDASGPIVLVDGYEAVQQQLIEGQQWAGGRLARIGLDGALGTWLTPADWMPYSVEQGGNVLAVSDSQLQGTPAATLAVFSGSGQQLWQTATVLGPFNLAGGYALSPDGSRLAMDGLVAGRDGSRIALAGNFATRGWLDSQTIIGLVGGEQTGRIGVIHMSAPTQVDDWGFTGTFVGRVSSP